MLGGIALIAFLLLALPLLFLGGVLFMFCETDEGRVEPPP
jgi:hypothetical protein